MGDSNRGYSYPERIKFVDLKFAARRNPVTVALRPSLDEQSSIVWRKLIQKLNFIAESDFEELSNVTAHRFFYLEQIDDCTLFVRYSLRQIYVFLMLLLR